MIKVEVVFDGNDMYVRGSQFVYTIEKINITEDMYVYACCINGNQANREPIIYLEQAIKYCMEN